MRISDWSSDVCSSDLWVRRYRVRVYGTPEAETLARLEDGVTVDGLRYGPIKARLDGLQGHNAWITVGLREGRNREVRRVMEHMGLREIGRASCRERVSYAV